MPSTLITDILDIEQVYSVTPIEVGLLIKCHDGRVFGFETSGVDEETILRSIKHAIDETD